MSDRARVRRPREVNTCQECRSRKVRCDLARPTCSRCQQLGLTCIYGEPSRRESAGPALIMEASSSQVAVATATVSEEYLRTVEERLQSLTDSIQSLHQSASERNHPAPELSQQPPSTKPVRHLGTDPPAADKFDESGGHLAIQGGGRTKYVNAYFWASICDEVSKLDELLQSQNRYDIIPEVARSQERRSSSMATSALSFQGTSPEASPARLPKQVVNPGGSIEDLFRQPSQDGTHAMPRTSRLQHRVVIDSSFLPSKLQCDFLRGVFLRNFQSLAPMIHVPSFTKEYEAFWSGLDTASRGTRASPAFVSLLYAVLFAGSVISSNDEFEETFLDVSRSQLVNDLYNKTIQALRQASFVRAPSVESFAAYLIAHSVWEKEEEPLQCCSFVGVAVRIAQMLGLNKDPSYFPRLEPTIAEVRRRLAWQLYYYDTTIATAAGLPPLIDDSAWDVQPVSEVKDDLIGTTAFVEYERQVIAGKTEPAAASSAEDDFTESLVATSGIFAKTKFQGQVIIKRLLSRMSQQRPFSQKDVQTIWADMEQLRSDTVSAIKRIPKGSIRYGSNSAPTTGTYATNGALNKFARISISGRYAKTWSLLYLPMMHGTLAILWPDLRTNIRRYSHRYLLQFIHFALDPDFQPFQWGQPGKHQPLHTLMILIHEVELFPADPNSTSFRTVVDEALALCGPDGSGITYYNGPRLTVRALTESGSEAWELIWRLRARAWTKAGADPDVLLTREEVYERAKERAEMRIGYAEDDAEPQREVGIAVLEGRLSVEELRNPYAREDRDGPLPPAFMREDVSSGAPGGEGPEDSGLEAAATPHIEWVEWENAFGGEEFRVGGDLNFPFGT